MTISIRACNWWTSSEIADPGADFAFDPGRCDNLIIKAQGTSGAMLNLVEMEQVTNRQGYDHAIRPIQYLMALAPDLKWTFDIGYATWAMVKPWYSKIGEVPNGRFLVRALYDSLRACSTFYIDDYSMEKQTARLEAWAHRVSSMWVAPTTPMLYALLGIETREGNGVLRSVEELQAEARIATEIGITAIYFYQSEEAHQRFLEAFGA